MSAEPAGLAAALADRYRIERELGQGGMATVYLAEDLRHGRKVAIKVLRPELAASLGSERFLREIEVAAQLQHPHILPLFDSGIVRDTASGPAGAEAAPTAALGSAAAPAEPSQTLFYVMPFVEGESLRRRLNRAGELSVVETARILRDVVDALAHAHRRGVVHRDIKPDNVLLSDRHALVADFGVAKAVSEATGRQSLTTVGVALGTPTYMAPEQAAADPQVDFRADLYAVGVMAYEMLTGAPPFASGSPQSILAAQLTESPRPITSVRATIPTPLAQLVMRCLEKRPSDRPASAEELVPVLEALGVTSGGTAPALAAVENGHDARVRRSSWWLLAAGLVVVLGGAGYGVLRAARNGSRSVAVAKSVAVLPFDNVGGDRANASFTDGVHDEILTDLTRAGALQVTSRTSVEEYRHTKKSVQQIGSELGVGTLLEGQVQRAGNQVHVSVQLVDVRSDRQVWANSYDRALSTENVFAIQGDIARNVAAALQANFTREQDLANATSPTSNLEALDWYQRGRTLFAVRDTAALSAFERAVALDSSFAAAWAWLAAAHSWQVRQGNSRDTTVAREALDRANALDPSSPETELGRAFYDYYARGDYDGALAHFRAAAAARPSDVTAIEGIGNVTKRQGRYGEALQALQRAAALDPRNAGPLTGLCQTYYRLRQPEQVAQSCRRAYILNDVNSDAAFRLGASLILLRGDTAGARAFLDSVPASAMLRGFRALLSSILSRWGGDYARADMWADTSSMLLPGPRSDPGSEGGLALMHGLNARAAGDDRRAREWGAVAERFERAALADSSRGTVFGLLAVAHSRLGMALALQGRGDEAVAEGERGVALNPPSYDRFTAPQNEALLVGIHLLLGQNDAAVRDIVRLAGQPFSEVTIPITRAGLRMDPIFAPIRNDPRIQALLANNAAWVVSEVPHD